MWIEIESAFWKHGAGQRNQNAKTQAGTGWFGELLAGKPASGGESLCHLRGSRGAERCRNPALGVECYARSDSSGPSVGALVPLRKIAPYKKSKFLDSSVAILLLLLECYSVSS